MLKSLVGTLLAFVGEHAIACKIVRLADGTLDVVTLAGGTSVGEFGTLRVLTVLKSGAAQRRLIDAGVLKYGRQTYIPAAWLKSADASVTSLDGWFESRLTWLKDAEQIAQHQALLAEVKVIIAAEKAN